MSTFRARTRAHPLLVTAAAAVLATTGAASAAAAPPDRTATPGGAPQFTDGRYVVVLSEPSAATYDGGRQGLAATEAAPGRQLDADAPAVKAYSRAIKSDQSRIAKSVGVRPARQYALALNGFAADLTAAQATKLEARRDVLAVAKDERHQLDTTSSPAFLGLSGARGVWQQTGGQGTAGKGVVVGVLDSGIWPENASFEGSALADGPSGSDEYLPYADGDEIVVQKADGQEFRGACETGEEFAEFGPTEFGVDECDTKLVTARTYPEGFLAALAETEFTLNEFEYVSPRDGDGHGSHTAGTAAGNGNVPVSIDNRSFGQASGMAPAATIAAYKVCWNSSDPGFGGCYTSDMVEAINQSIEDGVDVLNFSIGGGAADGIADPTDLAFLSAASAGIFVAASAGNSGPGASTHDHAAPWYTTVGASTFRNVDGHLKLGNGTVHPGATVTVSTPVLDKPLALSSAVAAAGKPANEVALCYPESLDPAKTRGKVVVCDRGVIDRVAKSAEVKRAGGVGMVLTNTTVNSLNGDLHQVPTVHVNPPVTAGVKAYAATAGATVSLYEGTAPGLAPTPTPQMAAFSSRGPTLALEGDLLKPDITAPGVDVIAAVSPPSHLNRQFDFLSGTSMSSPHVAGLAAFYLGEHPNWSPMAVKSAMMTTAYDVKGADGRLAADPFAQGAGHVDPTKFLNPGLVFDSSDEDWLRLLANEQDLGIDGIEPIDPSNFNAPSFAIGSLAGAQTVTRKLTAVKPGTYRATASVPGVTVTVSPSILTFTRPGETRSVKVTFTRTPRAAVDQYAKGFVSWSGAGTTVRTPVAVKPVALAAPAEVSAPASTSGSTTMKVTPGQTGPIDLSVKGLVPGDVTEDVVTSGPVNPAGDAANKQVQVTIPEGTTLARFDLVANDPASDLDLFLLSEDKATIVTDSATGDASERIDLLNPTPGTYWVHVNGFATTGEDPFTLRNFVVGAADAGNLTVSPDPLQGTLGRTATVTATWSGLTAGTPYLGWIGYSTTPNPTIVSIG